MILIQNNKTINVNDSACRNDLVIRLADFERPPNPELITLGWERRFIADGRRLKEFVELYESVGYEVHAEPVQPEEIGPECNDCRLIMCLQFHTLYTRKRS